MFWYKRPKKEFNPKRRLGLIHVYTGEGKGKTTAALGVAMRAAGHKMRVNIIQFLKGHKDYGEILILERLNPLVEITQFGTPERTDMTNPSAFELYLAGQGLEYARKIITAKQRPDILIFDEINPALHHNILPLAAVLDLLNNKPQNTEVILTGRNAPPEILNIADIVTVMTSTKHPYEDYEDEAFIPRYGIEH